MFSSVMQTHLQGVLEEFVTEFISWILLIEVVTTKPKVFEKKPNQTWSDSNALERSKSLYSSFSITFISV